MTADPPVLPPFSDRSDLPVPSTRATITALIGGALTAPILVAADHVLRARSAEAATERGKTGAARVTPVVLAGGGAAVAHVTNPGRSTAFVLTHGLACDHRLWQDYVGPLSASATVVTWDMPGHGSAPAPTDPRSALGPAALAAALCQVVEATTTAPARVVILGHSLGGLVSLLALRDHPALRGRVDAAVLIATPLTDLGRTMSETGRFGGLRAAGIRAGVSWALGNRLTHGLFGHPVNAVPSYGLVRNMGFGPRPEPAQIRRLRNLLAATPARIRQAALAGTFGIDVRGSLAHIDIPTVVVVGDHDRIVPARHSSEILDELPTGSLVRFPRAGHAVVLERAGPIVAHVLRFADGLAAADAS